MKNNCRVTLDPLTENKMDDVVYASFDAVDCLSQLMDIIRKEHLVARTCAVTGVSRNCIYGAISGERTPRIDLAVALLNSLGYDLKVVKL